MSAKKGGFDHEPGSLFQFFYHPQHFQLSLYGQPVSAFDLDGTGSEFGNGFQPFPRTIEQFIFAGFIQLICGIENAAAFCCYVSITQSVQLINEFVFPAGSKYNMRMTVAPGWQNDLVIRINNVPW